MISKSTKTKRRHNHSLLEEIKTIRVLRTDPRVDFWLISYPLTENKAFHAEVRGKKLMMKVYRTMLKRFRSEEKVKAMIAFANTEHFAACVHGLSTETNLCIQTSVDTAMPR